MWLFVIATKEILKNPATREQFLSQMILHPLLRGKIESGITKQIILEQSLIDRL
jgi:hypothetical protein